MEEDIEALRERFLGQGKHLSYPSERAAIRNRYADTAYYIFKVSTNS